MIDHSSAYSRRLFLQQGMTFISLAAGVVLIRQYVDRRQAADECEPHPASLDDKRRPLVGDLQGSLSRRIADDHVGGA